jgi:hypothetical protein
MPMPSTILIDDEARNLSQQANDIDNFRKIYSTSETSTDEEILIQFVAPKIQAFEDYRFCLLQNSNLQPLSPGRYYRPDYVSYDNYGTPNLWALILFINNIPTIEDFITENILIPTKKIISTISLDILERNRLKKLIPLSDIPPQPTSPLFSRNIPIPLYTSQSTTPPFYATDTYFFRESFTVDNVMAREKCINLAYVPIPESIVLKIKDRPNYLYNKHYTIIKGSNKFNRLTWDSRLILNGIGLTSILVEGTLFEVSYARKVV